MLVIYFSPTVDIHGVTHLGMKPSQRNNMLVRLVLNPFCDRLLYLNIQMLFHI